MKFSATDIASYMNTFSDDTATIGAETIDVIFKRGFVMTQVGAEQIESKEWMALVPREDAGDYTGLASLATTVQHGTALTVRSTNYTVSGYQEDDPIEGMTRLILTEA